MDTPAIIAITNDDFEALGIPSTLAQTTATLAKEASTLVHVRDTRPRATLALATISLGSIGFLFLAGMLGAVLGIDDRTMTTFAATCMGIAMGATAVLAVLSRAPFGVPKDIREYLKRNAMLIREIDKEIAAFRAAYVRIGLLKERTEHYDAILEQCETRSKELLARRDEVLAPLERRMKELRDADEQQMLHWRQEREAAAASEALKKSQAEKRRKLDREARELHRLQQDLPALLPSSAATGVTKDLTAFVGVLQAQTSIEEQTLAVPEDGSLPKGLISTEEEPLSLDRIRDHM